MEAARCIPLLAVCALCVPASNQVRAPGGLPERAKTAIVEALSRQSWPQTPPSADVEVLGEPVLRPEHAPYHVGRPPASADAPMPDAIVHAVVRQSKAFQQTALVYFVAGNPARDPVRSIPQGERMYAAPLGGPLAVFPHFVLVGESVRVVAVDMP